MVMESCATIAGNQAIRAMTAGPKAEAKEKVRAKARVKAKVVERVRATGRVDQEPPECQQEVL